MTKTRIFLSLICLAVFIFLAIGSADDNDNDEEVENDVEEEVVEPTLSEEEVDEVVASLEESLEQEGEFLEAEGFDMHILKLHSIEFDEEANQLNVVIDYQTEDLDGKILPAQELKDLNEGFTWGIVEATSDVYDKDFNVRVMAWTTLEDKDDILDWGTTRYRDGEYSFKEGTHFEMIQ